MTSPIVCNSPEFWAELQTTYNTTWDAWVSEQRRLQAQYQSEYYAPKGKQKALRVLRDRADRANDKVWAWLREYAPRYADFQSGIPAHWIATRMSYADATTRGPISATPPLAYGHTVAFQ